MPRLRSTANGVTVSVSDEKAARMVSAGWEAADSHEEPAAPAPAKKSSSRKPKETSDE